MKTARARFYALSPHEQGLVEALIEPSMAAGWEPSETAVLAVIEEVTGWWGVSAGSAEESSTAARDGHASDRAAPSRVAPRPVQTLRQRAPRQGGPTG